MAPMIAANDLGQGRDTASPNEIYIVGGQYKPSTVLRKGYGGFQKALILALNQDGAYVRTAVEYQSPPAVCPIENGSILFKSASLTEQLLYVCTETEVLIYRVPDFSLVNYISLPMFNDLHHATPSRNGSLFVVCTGLDAVLELSKTGEPIREWDLSGQGLWTRFDSKTDYRKIASTKPHLVHPNFVFLRDDEVWVTRLQQQDALRLVPLGGRIPIELERPHDGIVVGANVYFTTVDGRVVRADLARQMVDAVFDLADLFSTIDPLGWCRGLKVIDDDRVIVGFSRLRPTRWQSNVHWAARKLKSVGGEEAKNWDAFPTRISCLDLARGKILWERNLEPYGMNAVFSIL
jgi:hypothetical protein